MARRALRSRGVEEIYLTATPSPGQSVESQAREIYAALYEELAQSRASIFSERLFATADAWKAVERVRREIFGGIDGGVPPTRVVVSPSPHGAFAGAQLHAVRGLPPPQVLRCCDWVEGAAARLLNLNGHRWISITGLSSDTGITEAEQARRMFLCAGCFLRQAGGSMHSVARTWLWLKNICTWYDQFNQARTTFFHTEGLVDPSRRLARLPASTGIGLHGATGAACTLDLIALPGAEESIELVESGGDQESAFEYGSAFSRASVAPMPAGRTVFISGTAAIDRSGKSENEGQIGEQIAGTLQHVRSLLSQLDCSDEHVLTALAYCKNEKVEEAFRRDWPDLSWPRITMIGDVCRPELLFEVEVTASPELTPQAESPQDADL